MSEEQNSESKTQTSVDGTNTTPKTYTEEAYLKVLSEKDQLKQKIRQLEAVQKDTPNFKDSLDEALLEKSKLIEELNTEKEKVSVFEKQIREGKINTALSTALEAAGAKSKSTVMKLIDLSKITFDDLGEVNNESIVTVIKEIQESDSFLFGDIKDPKLSSGGQTPPGKTLSGLDVKRAGDGTNITQTAFQTELKAAKSQKEILDAAKKYGIIS